MEGAKKTSDRYILWLTFAALGCILILALISGRLGSVYNQHLFDETSTPLVNGWSVEGSDGLLTPVQIPLSLTYEGDGRVTLVHPLRDLPQTIGSPVILLRSHHMGLRVWLGDTLIYDFPTGPLVFSKSTGNTFHFIRLPTNYLDKELRVEVQLLLGNSMKYAFEEPLIGPKASILVGVAQREWPRLLTLGLTLVFGIMLLVMYLGMGRAFPLNHTTVYTGIFASVFAAYALFDMDLVHLMVSNGYTIYLATFLFLALLPPSVLMIFRDAAGPRFAKPFTVCTYFSLGNFFVQVALNYLKIADFREMLWITHGMSMLAIGMVFYVSLRIKWAENKDFKRLFFSAMPMMASVVIDMLYLASGYARYTGLFFQLSVLVFILAQMAMFLEAYMRSYREMVQSRVYQKLAFEDLLTGLGNRNAYEQYIAKLSEEMGRYASVWCISADINNLKETNDALGHHAGDLLIQESARQLQTMMEGFGEVYRTGGDEFVAFALNADASTVQTRVAGLRARVAEVNRKGDLKMQMAVGYDRFTRGVDTKLKDLVGRTDALMYADKKAQKEAEKAISG